GVSLSATSLKFSSAFEQRTSGPLVCVSRQAEDTYRGRDEIDHIAGVIKATHPDFEYQPQSAPEAIGDGCRVRWVSGSPGKSPAYAGNDFIIVRDARIVAVYLFFDELPN